MTLEKYDRQSVSTNKDWCTPLVYVEAIRVFFGKIALDPCSNKYSLVNSEVSYLPPQDGLVESWNYSTIFINPPYGRTKTTSIKDWIRKAQDTFKEYNNEIIMLIPASTNTKHWQEMIFHTAKCICFLKEPRVKFFNPEYNLSKGSPMACALVYWGNRIKDFEEHFKAHGKVINV